MLPDLLPGAEYNNELETLLKTTRLAAANARSAGGGARERVTRYLTFCAESTARLRHALRKSSLDDLLLTRRYWAILGMDPTSQAAGELVDLELFDCEWRLGEAADAVHDEWETWMQAGTIIVPDTNVLLHALPEGTTVATADWRGFADVRPMDKITVVLLLAVIDELDKTKRTNARPQARMRLKEINELLGRWFRTLVVPAGNSVGETYLGVMLDHPYHEPLAHTDSEIIDRTLSLERRAGRPVHLVTGDTGMVIRAAHVDLTCHHVETP